MERRKFVIGLGSLAAGGAAATGTGAFTSVSADRGLDINSVDDSDAFLSLEPEDSPNGDEYVEDDGTAISINLRDSDEGGYGVNTNAQTLFRNLFKITNKGSQKVYVWAEGLPDDVSMFHDDPDGENYKESGAGNNQGAFSDTSNLNPDDPADVNDPQNPGGYEAAPLLAPGDTLQDIGISVDSTGDHLMLNGTVTIKAVAESEVPSSNN